jgi:hypothetical protein
MPFDMYLLVIGTPYYITHQYAEMVSLTDSPLINGRLILTGTPIQNELMELWSLFDFGK